MPFNNPIVGGGGSLIRTLIRSLNYVAGVAGWAVYQDGTAEFSSLTSRGDFQSGPTAGAHVTMTSTGLRVYRTNGTLMFSVNTSTEEVTFHDDTGTEYAQFNALSQLGLSLITNFVTLSEVQFRDVVTTNEIPLRNGPFRIPAGIVTRATSTAATSSITTTETKDAGCGDLTFTALLGRRYRIFYRARCQTNVADSAIVLRVRDGGGSSPTNTSTIVAASQVTPNGTGGAGDEQTVNQILTCVASPSATDEIAAGTHKVAPFYVRTAGTGTVSVSQTLLREFYVYDEG